MENITVTVYWSPGQDYRLGSMLSRIAEALDGLNLWSEVHNTVAVRSIEVSEEEDAAANRIFGTPSIKINGIDVEQDLVMYEKPGLWERKYMDAGKEIPAPTIPSIKDALISALARNHRKSTT